MEDSDLMAYLFLAVLITFIILISLIRKKNTLISKLQSYYSELQEAKAELKKCNAEFQKYNSKLKAELQKSKTELEAKIQELENKLQEYKIKLKKSKTKLQDYKAKIEEYEPKIREYENEFALLQADYLSFKDRLIQRTTTYFEKTYKKPYDLEASAKLRKVINQVLTDYNSVFENPDETISEVSDLMADYLTYPILYEQKKMEHSYEYHVRQRALTVQEIRLETREILANQLALQYKVDRKIAEIEKNNVFEKVLNLANSNVKLIPYVAKIIADIETADFEVLAKSLDYGNSLRRTEQAFSIRQVKAEAKAKIESLKWAEYQLTYLLALYPALNDVIETEYEDLKISYDNITDFDPVRNYLTSEEWKNLSPAERNQLALDRYIESRKKSKWQIGRDYELYIGYLYQNKGYKIDYFGSYMGLEDLGRDLIATKKEKVLIIQCKYWSKEKVIHEKHIMQLYGSIVAYKIEHRTDDITGMLITNTKLSDTAKDFAEMLKIEYLENEPLGSFPRIKCNIGRDETGETYIYHLPMDLQYDKTKIEKKGEIMVSTVQEAEKLGFRRAYKWHGDKGQ